MKGLQDFNQNQLPAEVVLNSFPSALGITKTPPVTIWEGNDFPTFFAAAGSFVAVNNGEIAAISLDLTDTVDNIVLELNVSADRGLFFGNAISVAGHTLENTTGMDGVTYTPIAGSPLPPAVPEPSSLLLLAAGLAGLAGFSRMIKKSLFTQFWAKQTNLREHMVSQHAHAPRGRVA